MQEFFSRLSAGTIVRIALFAAAVVILLVIYLVIRHKIKRFFAARRKEKELLESLKIDTIRTDALTRADVHTWFEGSLNNGCRGMLMTAQALKAKDNDIKLPSCPAGSELYYLAVYSPDKDKTLRQRFIAARSTEPELAQLLADNSGSVVFEA